MAFGGQGLAHLDNLVVFIKQALPQDRARVKLTKFSANFAEAELVEIIKPSPWRISPRCSHFGVCGGCKWQNLDYAKQVECKTNQVREALQHLGGFAEPAVLSALSAQDIYFYRNKMEFSFATDVNGQVTVGLHRAGKYDEVFDLQTCYLQSETSNRIVSWIKTFCREKKLTVYDLRQHSGFLRFLVIKEAKNSGEVMVNFVTHQGDSSDLLLLAKELTDSFSALKSVVRNINTQKAQIAVGEKEELLAGRNYILEKIGPFQFQISANSFFQSNSQQAGKLYQVATEFAHPETDQTTLDLYSGTGTISFFLAQRAKEVIGVESNPHSVENANKNAALNSITNCRFICSEAKDYLALASLRREKFASVIVDPPRSGLHPKAVENLIKLSPPKIVYVSCNPATLARDLKLLCEREYRLEVVQPVDMFPHTYHIESVCKLSKR